MKRFNPEKELNKIRNGNKKKVIISICTLLLVVGVIGYSFALYQVRHSVRIIYTKVAPFSKYDINLAVYLNDKLTDDFPDKNSGNVYDKIVCENNTDNHVKAYWDDDKWGLVVETTKKAKCNVYFKTGSETSTPNPPELYQGLIPIKFDENGKVIAANPDSSDWYNYDEKRWANAVLVDASNTTIKNKYFDSNNKLKTDIVGKEVPMEEILQMYVWIPRYKYKLFNVHNVEVPEQEIQIKFEKETESTGNVSCETSLNGIETCRNDANGNWYTHPAFTFGNTELKGIWVGKFESGGEISDIKIVPNVSSLVNVSISEIFFASRNMEETNALKYNLDSKEIDTHPMKNMDWGAMAYLSQSKYGICDSIDDCPKIELNSTFTTGYDSSNNSWNTTDGVKASTTRNIYGIYDTSGGAIEWVMVNMVDNEGNFSPGSSGFESAPKERYYDKYEYGENSTEFQRGHLGDATREVIKIRNGNTSGWYESMSVMSWPSRPWLSRGGTPSYPGPYIYGFGYSPHGGANGKTSFRVVITAQDGNE